MRTTRTVLPLLIMLAACQTVPAGQPSRTAPVVGAPTAHAAVAMFMSGMQQRDLATIGNIWGTRDWLVRDHYSRDEFEKRALITACYLGWDGYRITAETAVPDHARAITIQSTAPGREQQTKVRVEQSSRGRWFVEGLDLRTLTPVSCQRSATVAR